MKNRWPLIMLLLLTSAIGTMTAQNFDHLMVKKQLDCPDVSYNSAMLFKEYYQSGKLDSAQSLLTYWEQKCGMREPIFRARLLLNLRQGTYNDTETPEKVFDIINIAIYRYQTKSANLYSTYEAYRGDFGYIPPMQDFDLFISAQATELSKLYETGTIERLWCNFLSNPSDNIFAEIQNAQFSDTRLYNEHQSEVNRYKDLPDWNLAWMTGVWVPTGELAKLGVHPDLGFQMGTKLKKWSYDLTMCFKFGKTANPYYARRANTTNDWEQTTHFFGGYIGLDAGRDIFVNRRHEWQALGGIAFDGFDVFKSKGNYDETTESTASYNFNVGLGYRYYYKQGRYIGVRGKFNLVDYTLNNVIDLKGNALTFHLVIGGLTNVHKYRNLERLKYKTQ